MDGCACGSGPCADTCLRVLGRTDSEFTQLIKGLQGERLRQAFRYFDKDGDGYIRPEEFQRIVLELAGHKLSDPVLERLPTLCTLSPGQKISYSEVIAFHNIIRGESVFLAEQ